MSQRPQRPEDQERASPRVLLDAAHSVTVYHEGHATGARGTDCVLVESSAWDALRMAVSDQRAAQAKRERRAARLRGRST